MPLVHRDGDVLNKSDSQSTLLFQRKIPVNIFSNPTVAISSQVSNAMLRIYIENVYLLDKPYDITLEVKTQFASLSNFYFRSQLDFHFFFSLLPYWFRVIAALHWKHLKIFHPTQLTWPCKSHSISSWPAARWFSRSQDWSSHILRFLVHCFYHPSSISLPSKCCLDFI